MKALTWMLLKTAEIWPLHKKDGRIEKSNYRPISVHSNVSKNSKDGGMIKFNFYFDQIFSEYQCGFSKRISRQSILLTMILKNENFALQ